jgi:hypothetical protein
LGKAWERFNTLVDSGPNLSLAEPILLQHFFVGLNKKTIKHLNSSAGGLLIHITAEHAKDILMKIVDNLPEENEKLLEEETKIAKPEILPEPCQPLVLAILDPEPPKEEETIISDFILEFKDELFDDYGKTSKYHMMKKPQEYKNPSFIDPSEKEFFKRQRKSLCLC